MNKRGMTLMELLVYMAIVGIVVVVAGTAFTNSTKMRIRTESKLSAGEAAEQAGMLLKEDIAQMGAKSFLDGAGYSVNDAVYMDPSNADATLQDYSSFAYTPGTEYDSLYFKKMRYGEDGSFLAVEAIAWYAEDETLYRACQTLQAASGATIDAACPTDAPNVMAIAEEVQSFKVQPAKPAVIQSETTVQLFPVGGGDSFKLLSRADGTDFFRAFVTPEDGGTSVTISGFTSNYDTENEEYTTNRKANQLYAAEANGNVGDWNDLCTKLTLNPDTTYQLSFVLPRTGHADNSQTFIPGVDYMSVGFRSTSGEKVAGLPDFAFYPTTAASANSATRDAFFSVSSKVENVCIAFTFAPYSPLFPSGSIAISQLTLKKVADLNFRIVDGYVPEIADKANVRAFKYSLVLKRNRETGVSSHVVAVPSNGVGAN